MADALKVGMTNQVFEGSKAWRNGFSIDAADLLQIVRWGAQWSDETFKLVLIIIARRSKGLQTNIRTVDNVLEMLSREGLLTTSCEKEL